MSPLLFTIFINDLPNCISSAFALYADDFCFGEVDTKIDELTLRVQDSLNKIFKWANDWGINILSSKSAAVLLTKKHKRMLTY